MTEGGINQKNKATIIAGAFFLNVVNQNFTITVIEGCTN